MAPAAAAARPVSGTHAPCYLFDTSDDLAEHVARVIAGIVRERNAIGQKAVLGLPTGSTPMGVYRELIRLHKEENLDFSNVVTFNLDEYYGLAPDRLQSYHRWMREHLFDHINIPSENVHVPDGMVPLDKVDEYCRQYEDEIEKAGGIDLQLLGIGRNGHIGFNEPFTVSDGRTRLCMLDPVTRSDASSDFFSKEHVPSHAITMGLGTILEARKIILIALGEHKAPIIHQALEESEVSSRIPASLLRNHGDASFFVDLAAGSKLVGVNTPWLQGNVEWTDPLIKRAILWLCEQTGKALLKLDDNDLREHSLHQLLRHHGPAQKVAHRVFRWLMDTIEYHPAGRDPQRVICFSPHPDDDVISMGGTLIRLVEDKHETHIAYMTSGNIAVFDHDVRHLADLVTEFNRYFSIDEEKSPSLEEEVLASLGSKLGGEPDSPKVLAIKGLIRWGEAKAGAAVCGVKEEHLHFLDLPFYHTGTVAKNPVGAGDVRIIRELLERVKPTQIYVAGDLSDPHGTHRVCAEAIFMALNEMGSEGLSVPEVMLYRGAWQEWPVDEIETAVPLSPHDITQKRAAIFRHESQKDSALFPGADPREFWQRAEDRNRNTADLYNQLGLPEYYAMEAFVRWKGTPI